MAVPPVAPQWLPQHKTCTCHRVATTSKARTCHWVAATSKSRTALSWYCCKVRPCVPSRASMASSCESRAKGLPWAWVCALRCSRPVVNPCAGSLPGVFAAWAKGRGWMPHGQGAGPSIHCTGTGHSTASKAKYMSHRNVAGPSKCHTSPGLVPDGAGPFTTSIPSSCRPPTA